MFNKNDLVELENGSRLHVVSVDDDLVHLSLKPNGNVIARILMIELTLVQRSKFVWLLLNDGMFTDSWEIDGTKSTDPNHLIADIQNHPHVFGDSKPKLIEYRCHNDDTFEFNHFMKLR